MPVKVISQTEIDYLFEIAKDVPMVHAKYMFAELEKIDARPEVITAPEYLRLKLIKLQNEIKTMEGEPQCPDAK